MTALPHIIFRLVLIVRIVRIVALAPAAVQHLTLPHTPWTGSQCKPGGLCLAQVLSLASCRKLGCGAALLTPGFGALRELDLSWCIELRSSSLTRVGCGAPCIGPVGSCRSFPCMQNFL